MLLELMTKKAVEFRGNKAKTNFPLKEYIDDHDNSSPMMKVEEHENDQNVMNGDENNNNGDDFWATLEDDRLVKFITQDMSH